MFVVHALSGAVHFRCSFQLTEDASCCWCPWKLGSGWTSLSCHIENILLCTIVIRLCFVLQRKWYDTENEYYLLLFTVSVRCLFCTSFSLEYCWHGPAQKSSHSFLWMLAYVFYYPTFHNGPLLNFDEFSKQVTVFLRSSSYRFLVHLHLGWIGWRTIEAAGDVFSDAKSRHKSCTLSRLKHDRLFFSSSWEMSIPSMRVCYVGNFIQFSLRTFLIVCFIM